MVAADHGALEALYRSWTRSRSGGYAECEHRAPCAHEKGGLAAPFPWSRRIGGGMRAVVPAALPRRYAAMFVRSICLNS